MHYFRRISAAVCGLALALVCACSDDSAPVDPIPPGGDASYHWVNPVSQRASLSDVWGPTANNLLATGNFGVVLRYDGNAWRRTQTPATGSLNAIWGADATHAFAVGQDGVILFFNGTQWVQQTSPTTEILNDVWGSSASDVYAVGAQRKVIHFDGADWSTVPLQVGVESFQSVWGSDPGNIYVTGLDRKLLHYDGNSWGEVATGATFSLNVVWGTDSLDVFALGGNGAAAHYDGTWSNIDIGEPLNALGVWGTATSDVYAMGGANGNSGSAYHWDGFSWTRVEMNSMKGINNVFGVDGRVFAVGPVGLIHEKSGTEFVAMDGGLTADLDAVWVSSAGNEAFAVGELGTILHFERGAWTPMNSGTKARLRGLGGACSCNLLAVGDNGTVLHYDGATWSDASPGVAVSLSEAWMDASGTAFVVGDLGTVLQYENGIWSPLSFGGITNNFLSVWGFALDNVYIVGDEAAFKWIGTQPKKLTIDPVNARNYHSVFGVAADDVFVASELKGSPTFGTTHRGGDIYRWDGEQWISVFADPIQDVLSVWRSGQQGFATGNPASLLRDPDGSAGWTHVWDVANLPDYVNSVWGSSMQNVFVVGNDGTIIRYSP